jgi:hypothetical protein
MCSCFTDFGHMTHKHTPNHMTHTHSETGSPEARYVRRQQQHIPPTAANKEKEDEEAEERD